MEASPLCSAVPSLFPKALPPQAGGGTGSSPVGQGKGPSRVSLFLAGCPGPSTPHQKASGVADTCPLAVFKG